jgi:undecaprenyl-diphosphatase
MPIASVLVLAVLQGLTEFLPVSSKTHLLFAQVLLGQEPDLALTVVLHAGSLLAILAYYGRAWIVLARERRKEILLLAVASLPAVAAALLFKRHLEGLYRSPAAGAGLLLVTGAWLVLSERLGRERHDLDGVPVWKILLVGVAQAFALLPGISRSGSTIGMGYLVGLRRPEAVRFSFFMGAVAIAGALLFMGKEIVRGKAAFAPLPILLGVLVTFAVSLAAIKLVESLSLRGRLSWFAAYCGAAGVAGLLYFTMRG